MVATSTINASRLALSGLAILAIGSGMAIIGMGYEIKRHTPYEAVQIVLFIIGALVILAQLSAFLTMFLVQQLLIAFASLEGVSLLSSIIVVICVKLREDDVLNTVAKLPAAAAMAPDSPMSPPMSADLATRVALRHHTQSTLDWGVPIIIVSIILQAAVIVLVGVTWFLAMNEGTVEERQARREKQRQARVDRLKTDVQMTARNQLYQAEKRDNEVLRAHMERTYGAHTHGDAWKKEERKKFLGIF